MTIHSFRSDFAQTARASADTAAIIDARNDRQLSYSDTAALIGRFGALFRDHGLTQGATIVTVGANCVEILIAFFAAAQHGFGFLPLSVEAPPEDVRRWVGRVKPSLAIVTEGTGEAVLDALRTSGVTTISVPQDGRFEWLPNQPAWTSVNAGHSGRLYLTTSGSTGEPRALVFDTDVLWSSANAFVGVHRALLDKMRFWNILPMSYLGGLFNLGLIPLAAGGSVVVSESFSGRSFFDFWQNVERFEVDVLWLVPTIVRGLLSLAQRTRRMEVAPGRHKATLCLLGTAPIDLATKRKFEDVFGIPALENFALSETTFLTSETLAGRRQRSESSVGEILSYADLQFRPVSGDEDSGGGNDHPTEILARSPYAFVGYMLPDGRIESPRDSDGFMATGDLGRIENGQVVITGRLRDIVKKGGYFIALTETEVLARQHPAVEEAAAVGIPHNFYGEDYVLYVRFSPENANAEADFGHWLRQNLAKYKWPDKIVPVTEFPRTPSGKIRKHLIASKMSGGGPAA